ncbi:MAG: NAD(P)/FAD-dependent oxidoreductase [Ruthenibacterium lactatiformans]
MDAGAGDGRRCAAGRGEDGRLCLPQCPGLYLSGEVLDAAGDCGGFNLQWAWATGIAAGRAAAPGCKKQNTRG